MDRILRAGFSETYRRGSKTTLGKFEINDFILYRFWVNGDDEELVYLLKKFFKLSSHEALKYVNGLINVSARSSISVDRPEAVKILKYRAPPEVRIAGVFIE